jgi:putative endonuclease
MCVSNYQTGINSEKKAVVFLQKNKHTVLQQRYKTNVGEIDIISVKDSILHITEVKKRKTLKEARESVSLRQQRRINNAVDVFLQNNNATFAGVQMDVIFIANNELRHLENAWAV